MAIKLGTTTIRLPYLSAYVGDDLIWKYSDWILKKGRYIPTFTAEDVDSTGRVLGPKNNIKMTYTNSATSNTTAVTNFYNIFDGDTTTYASFPIIKSCTHYLVIDFGKSIKPLEMIFHFFNNNFSSSATVTIMLSKDNSAYDTMITYTASSNTVDKKEDALVINEMQDDYRYMKIVWGSTAGNNTSSYKEYIYEIQITKWYEKFS